MLSAIHFFKEVSIKINNVTHFSVVAKSMFGSLYYNIVHIALIKEIGINGERVEELLNHGKGKLGVQCLNQTLELATRMDSYINVCKIALAHPTNIAECIKIAERMEKHHAHAMLLLIKVALSGDIKILNHLVLESVQYYRYKEDLLPLVYCGLLYVTVSSNVPIEIARQNNQTQLMHELVMKTNVYPEEGYIYWIGLQLHELSVLLLERIYWVKNLWLSRNKLATLPDDIDKYLNQVYACMCIQYSS